MGVGLSFGLWVVRIHKKTDGHMKRLVGLGELRQIKRVILGPKPEPPLQGSGLVRLLTEQLDAPHDLQDLHFKPLRSLRDLHTPPGSRSTCPRGTRYNYSFYFLGDA